MKFFKTINLNDNAVIEQLKKGELKLQRTQWVEKDGKKGRLDEAYTGTDAQLKITFTGETEVVEIKLAGAPAKKVMRRRMSKTASYDSLLKNKNTRTAYALRMLARPEASEFGTKKQIKAMIEGVNELPRPETMKLALREVELAKAELEAAKA